MCSLIGRTRPFVYHLGPDTHQHTSTRSYERLSSELHAKLWGEKLCFSQIQEARNFLVKA